MRQRGDKNSNRVIVESLKRYNIPILSEEGRDIPYQERKNWSLFWLIDPIDGTKEFVNRNGEFTVNIALIDKDTPVFGIVYAPAIEQIYFTDKDSAYKASLSVDNFELKNIEKLPLKNNRDSDKIIVVASKSHFDEDTKKFIEELAKGRDVELVNKGSSLKLCLIAEGSADIYPRLSPNMEWDTGAADAIAEKQGTWYSTLTNNKPLIYYRESYTKTYS